MTTRTLTLGAAVALLAGCATNPIGGPGPDYFSGLFAPVPTVVGAPVYQAPVYPAPGYQPNVYRSFGVYGGPRP